MTEYEEYGDYQRLDFTYPFLKGIDVNNPPLSISVPQKYLDAMGNMERQYWEIKANHYNVLVFFKKGKFYELYDYDAVIANREFGLRLTFDSTNRGKMRLAGVPEQSFSEWARLFVFRGYRVGRVEQIKNCDDENSITPATKGKIIARELVEVLTPGTVTDPAMLSDHGSVFILSLVPVVKTSLIDAFAVDLSRRVVYWCPCGEGKVIQQYYSHPPAGIALNMEPAVANMTASRESAYRSLSALLQQLHPREIIVPCTSDSEMARATAAVTDWVAGEGFNVQSVMADPLHCRQESDGTDTDGVPSVARQLLRLYFLMLRLDRGVDLLSEATLSTTHLHNCHALALPNAETHAGTASNPSFLAMERRTDHGLVLDASTVSNLEIVSNLQDGTDRLSINATVNRCCTNGGKRLFRAWLLRPSASPAVMQARQEVVRYLVEQSLYGEWGCDPQDLPSESQDSSPSRPSVGQKRWRTSSKGSFEDHFSHLTGVDFERNLSRLADMKMARRNIAFVDPLVQYKKNLGIILSTMSAFGEMVRWAETLKKTCCVRAAERPIPPLLDQLLTEVERASVSVEAMGHLFDRQEAEVSGMVIPAPGTCLEYDHAVERLKELEGRLNAERKRAQQNLFGGADVGFTDLGKDLFLMEVAVNHAPKMTPHGLVERARNSKCVKYVAQSIEALVEEYRSAVAAKSNALLNVLCSVATCICEHCSILHAAASALSYFDCLMNLSRLYERYGSTMCFPRILDYSTEEQGCAHLIGENLIHPLLTTIPVPNTIHLDSAHGRVLVLTGPNMAGKSTLMRTVAVNVLLAQLGGPVFGTAMELSPITRIFTRIGARDATTKGQSTLFVELSETAEILRSATGRSLCLIDELGRGTSTHDGFAIAYATLQALKGTAPLPPLTLFSTHYHALAQEQERQQDHDKARRLVQLGYMNFALSHGESSVPNVTFLFHLVSGICTRSYGVEVALMAGIGPTTLQLAQEKSDSLSRQAAKQEDAKTVMSFVNLEGSP